MQEEDDYQDHQQNGLQKRVNHRLDRVPHENRRIIHHRIINAFREILFQLFHRLADSLGKLEGVRARRLKDGEGDGGLVIQQRAQRIATGA